MDISYNFVFNINIYMCTDCLRYILFMYFALGLGCHIFIVYGTV